MEIQAQFHDCPFELEGQNLLSCWLAFSSIQLDFDNAYASSNRHNFQEFIWE